ncbi:MAG: xanthine dehydrogenase family protein molybdopterin-binding subunit, partial [Thermoanaerobaculia bacterium]|nr:xanthine dehydrogenase family protein molybdopterin-binding subunit [Thermoanaerobaculia bacterium]
MAIQKKKLEVIHGILPGELDRVEREVPAGEPPSLAPNADLRSIGKKVHRLDGELKVTGEARYTADVRLPGMLWAAILAAPHP